MNIFDLLRKKPKQTVFNMKNVNFTITAGSWCPNCKGGGAAFYNKSYYYNNIFRPAIYLCENCCKNWQEDEYNRLLLIAQRKQKLNNINDTTI